MAVVEYSFVCLLLLGCAINTGYAHKSEEVTPESLFGDFTQRFAVANRGTGTVLLFDAEDNGESFLEIHAPAGAAQSSMMYASNSLYTDEMWVGDRANNRVLVYDTLRYKVQAVIDDVCNGIFHQWTSATQFWIGCDIDQTLVVFDVFTRARLATIDVAMDANYKVHDFSVFGEGDHAYVSLIGTDVSTKDTGYIVQYNTDTFAETRRIQTGGDPHLYTSCCAIPADYLYVAAQVSSTVYKYDVETLDLIDSLPVNGAHGIWANLFEQVLFVTDITAADGTGSVVVIDLDTFTVSGTYNSVVGSAHNIASNADASRVYVTHSGPGAVTMFHVDRDNQYALGDQHVLYQQDGAVPFGVMQIKDTVLECQTSTTKEKKVKKMKTPKKSKQPKSKSSSH